MRAINTNIVNEILSRYNKGEKISRTDNIFYQYQEGTLNSKFKYSLTYDELSEYVKCSNNIEYFIEEYLGIKLIKFQKEWLENFKNNRFIINMVSRQCGINTIYSAIFLHYMIFNIDKRISVLSNNSFISKEFIDLMFKWYLKIPYFLKPGLLSHSKSVISFNNGSKIKVISKEYEKSDIMFYLDFALIKSSILESNFTDAICDISTSLDTKIIVTSTPNGMNLFMNLVQNSERKVGDPLKNSFITTRTYWWEVEGRDQSWKEKTIYELGGSEDLFNQEYDLRFIQKK